MYEQIKELVQNHGLWFYVTTFLWAFFEGETFLIFAGLLASQDLLHLWSLILVAGAGTTCGDFGFFLLGRRYGPSFLKKVPRLAEKQVRIAAWLEKHDFIFIMTYRYIYGLRNISAITIGTSKIAWQRYFILNFFASYLWAVVFAGGGYLFGDLIAKEGEDPINSLMIGALILFLIVLSVHFLRTRRKNKQTD
jgi:membrane protein DedA with SNARE-associated domain